MESVTYSSVADNEENRTLLNGNQSNKNSSEFKTLSVAAKKLACDANLKDFIEQFKELELMSNVGQHANIINLIGKLIFSLLKRSICLTLILISLRLLNSRHYIAYNYRLRKAWKSQRLYA